MARAARCLPKQWKPNYKFASPLVRPQPNRRSMASDPYRNQLVTLIVELFLNNP
jgi:hypothetical protein